MDFKNLNDLFNYLQEQIKSTLNDEVAQKIKEIEKNVIYEEVYDKYKPQKYERRYENSGLVDIDNIKATTLNVKDEIVLKIENITRSNENFLPVGQPIEFIAPMIEYGYGYDYISMKPRRFTLKTKEILKSNNQHILALKNGLKKRKIFVE